MYAVILAGGSGTRFWPLSRRARPKQCLSLDGGPSLIQRTVRRLGDLVPPERVRVVTGRDMEAAVRAELPELRPEHVLVEASGRNTAPSIAWAVATLRAGGDENDVVIVLPSDHHVEDEVAFRAALRAAVAGAGQLDGLMTLGLSPSRPETGFGYLELGAAVGELGGAPVHQVAAFREKPDLSTARRYVEGGGHLWNAGMFVFRLKIFWAELRAQLPATAAALEGAGATLPEATWLKTDAISVDYGIMERSAAVFTVPCQFGWSDVGSWLGAEGLLPAVEGGRGRAARVLGVGARGNVVWAPGRTVALVGVEDLAVIDVDDAILVMPKAEAEALRALLGRLRDEAPELT